jgi:GTPase SAR1 family protein
MKLWDLGGQAKFRDSWEKFCRDSDVIIFVVDSYDQSNCKATQPISIWQGRNCINSSAIKV